jgi:hypothetical protein
VNGHSSAHLNFECRTIPQKRYSGTGTEYCTPTPVFLAARKPSAHSGARELHSSFRHSKLNFFDFQGFFGSYSDA